MRGTTKKAFGSYVWAMVMCVCSLMLFAGCGKQEGNISGASEEVGTSTFWKEKGMVWKAPMSVEIEDEHPYTEIAYGSVIEPEPKFSYLSKEKLYDYWQNNQYTLTNYQLASGKRYLLAIGKESATEWEVVELTCLTELPKGQVLAMDVVNGEDISLLYGTEDEGSLQYLLLHLDSQGQMVSQEDLTEAYKGQELTSEDFTHGRWHCDEKGNSYILAREGQRLVIFDAHGKMLFGKGFSREQQEYIKGTTHAGDGSLIMWLEDNIGRNTKILWYNIEKKKLQELVTLDCTSIKQLRLTDDGRIYYIANSNLWCWNTEDGSHENRYSLLGGVVPYSLTEYVSHISMTEKGNLLLYIVKENGLEYCLLSNEPQDEGIRLVDMGGHIYISGRVTAFNREYPESKIKYEKETDYGLNDQLWKRTLAELTAGKGPDIICMYIGDEGIEVLYEKGILADLSDVLPREVEEQIFAPLLEAGTKEGKLIGICPEAMADVLVVSDALWEKEHWSQEEALELVLENSDLEGIYYGGGLSSLSNLRFLATYHTENSPWIDWEKGESHFEREDFKTLLKVAKEYGEKAACKEDEKVEFLREGSYVATREMLYHQGHFPQLMKKYSEDFHFIGYPGQENYVGYWNSGYLVMVNQRTAYWEECKEFLNFIMSEENLWYTSMSPSREDVIRKRQVNMWDGWYMAANPDFSGAYDFNKPDGTSYFEEYMSLLENLGPEPKENDIQTIIWEEADAYFKGGADLDRVVEVIDSRVQLYLDERK